MLATYPVNRDRIVQALTASLEPRPFVQAFWEGGAIAFGRIDAWSDLDLYVVVDDDRVADGFRAVEDGLTALVPIEVRYEVPWPLESGIAQRFYRVAGASPFLLVDLAVLKASAPDKFLEPELHGPATFYLNRMGLKPPHLDADAFLRTMLERRDRLRTRMDIFGLFVEKEVNRGHALEAWTLYQRLILEPLLEVLRMRHGPLHYGFRERYIYAELPPNVLVRLEHLAFVRDAEDVRAKYEEARRWFDEVSRSITEDDARRLVDVVRP